MFHNVGGITQLKWVEIARVILMKCCDVTVLLETRITQSHLAVTLAAIKTIPPGFHVIIYPTNSEDNVLIGGAIVITSPRVRNKAVHQLTPLGALVEVKGAIGENPFAVYGTYIPQHAHHNAAGSMYVKVRNQLHQHDTEEFHDPYQHIKERNHQQHCGTSTHCAGR